MLPSQQRKIQAKYNVYGGMYDADKRAKERTMRWMCGSCSVIAIVFAFLFAVGFVVAFLAPCCEGDECFKPKKTTTPGPTVNLT